MTPMSRSYADAKIRFMVELGEDDCMRATFVGRGSNDGTRRLVQIFDEMIGHASPRKLCLLMDLTEMSGTPVRTPLILGKWLLKNKQHIERVAVFGANPAETAIASSIVRIARFDAIRVFEQRDVADKWLAA